MNFGTEPVASVVIPAHNAADTLPAQLEALAAQIDVGPLEVIVVDNLSSDGTADVAAAWKGALPRLRVLAAADRPGPSYARNFGIENAASDLILLCDADDVVDPGWVRALLDGLERGDLVSGFSIWVDENLNHLHDDEPYRHRLNFLYSIGTNNAAMRKNVWQLLDGFDEELATAEDLDFAWRFQLAGGTIVREERAIVQYRQRGGWRQIVKREFLHGRGTVEIYLRYRSKGMPRSSTSIALKAWIMLLVKAPFVWRDPDRRRFWCKGIGARSGRLIGSLKRRTLYL